MKHVYLDQNHWSYLSLALQETPRTPEDGVAAETVVQCVTAGEASFPLSTAHVFETWKQHRAEKRLPLAKAMMEISRNDAIASPQRLVPAELDRALHRRFGRPEHPPEVQPFGHGLAHLSGGLAPELDPELVRYIREAHPGFDETQIVDWTDALLLAGPAADLPVAGIGQPPLQFAEGFAADQTELQERFKREGTSKDERRRAVAASMLLDIQEPLKDALRGAHVALDEFMDLDRSGLIDFMLDLPSRVALLELMWRQHADLGTKWVANDLNDLVYLSAAIGYCDIVVTERRWSAILNSTDVPSRTATVVLAKLADLPAHLETNE
jgi:hypothetical protein